MVPQLYEFHRLDSVPRVSTDASIFRTPEGEFTLSVPSPWKPMPQKHIAGYFNGREPGHYGDDDTVFQECSSGGGSITWGILRSPGYDYTALFTGNPKCPRPGDSAGMVFVTHHDRRFGFSKGAKAIAAQIGDERIAFAKDNDGVMSRFAPSGRAVLGEYQCFTSVVQFGYATNVSVDIVVPEQGEVWAFILLAPPATLDSATERFIAMLYSLRFEP